MIYYELCLLERAYAALVYVMSAVCGSAVLHTDEIVCVLQETRGTCNAARQASGDPPLAASGLLRVITWQAASAAKQRILISCCCRCCGCW